MRFKKAETLFVEGGNDDAAENASSAAADAPPRRQPASSSSLPPSSSTGAAPKLDASNPGYSMLRSMGWSESEHPGLGKKGQGRREPIEAVPRRARAGLGSSGGEREEEKKPEQQQKQQKEREKPQRRPPPPPPPPVDPAVAAARRRGAALVAELLSNRDLAGGPGSADASQRALNPLLDPEGAPARRHRRRNPLLLQGEEGEGEKERGGESVQ